MKNEIKAVVDLINDMEDKDAIVRLAFWEGEFIATVEVHDWEGDEKAGARTINVYLEDVKEQINLMRLLTEDDRDVLFDLVDLTKNMSGRGEILDYEGRSKDPGKAVANLLNTMRKSYANLIDGMPSNLN